MYSLTAYDVIKVDNCFYYFANEMNLLMRLERFRTESRIIASIPDEPFFSKRLIAQLICIDRKVVCVPLNAKRIYIYDLERNTWLFINIRNCGVKLKFMKAVKYEDNLFFLPLKYPEIAVMNISDYSIRYINIADGFYRQAANRVWFRSDIVQKGKIVYAACCDDDCIIKLNMESGTFEWIKTHLGLGGYSGISYDGELFWLSLRKDASIIVGWNENRKGGFYIKQTGFDNNSFIRGISCYGKDIIIRGNEGTFIINQTSRMNSKSEKIACLVFKSLDDEALKLTDEGRLLLIQRNREEYSLLLGLDEKKELDCSFFRNYKYGKWDEPLLEHNFINLRVFIKSL